MYDDMIEILKKDSVYYFEKERNSLLKEIDSKISNKKKKIEIEKPYFGKNRIKVLLSDMKDEQYNFDGFYFLLCLTLITSLLIFIKLIYIDEPEIGVSFVLYLSVLFGSMNMVFLLIAYYNLPVKSKLLIDINNLYFEKIKMANSYEQEKFEARNFMNHNFIPKYFNGKKISLLLLKEIKNSLDENIIRSLLAKGKNKDIFYKDLIMIIKNINQQNENNIAYNKVMLIK